MDRLHDVARLLISSLALANGEENPQIPTSHGVLDRAIRDAYTQFPEWAQKEIHIADSRVGSQCVELPAILGWAQAAELTSAPNPSYRRTELQVSQRVARILLKRLGVPEGDAKRLGDTIMASIQSGQNEPDEVAIAD
ncbi:MAG: hypothetical protein ACLPWF_23005 [Bryobacteraceae bacterium]